jgi:beta-glucosidase/6-phospho-beta-glucosidase/beta-galactosidase
MTCGRSPRFGLLYIDYATQRRVVKDSGARCASIIREAGATGLTG